VTVAKSVYKKLKTSAANAKKLFIVVMNTKKETKSATSFSATSKLLKKLKILNQKKIAKEKSLT